MATVGVKRLNKLSLFVYDFVSRRRHAGHLWLTPCSRQVNWSGSRSRVKTDHTVVSAVSRQSPCPSSLSAVLSYDDLLIHALAANCLDLRPLSPPPSDNLIFHIGRWPPAGGSVTRRAGTISAGWTASAPRGNQHHCRGQRRVAGPLLGIGHASVAWKTLPHWPRLSYDL